MTPRLPIEPAKRRQLRSIPVLAALALASLGAGCGQRPPAAESVAPPPPAPAPATAAPPAIRPPPPALQHPSPPQPPELAPEPPDPGYFLVVTGGPDPSTVWRGWPVFIRLVTLDGPLPERLEVAGPVPLAPARVEHGWIIPADVSATLAPGTYRFTAGEAASEIEVADPPARTDPEQEIVRHQVAGWVAHAQRDWPAALAAARAWEAAEPESVDAHLALGDAHWALGDAQAALRAYERGVALWPRHSEAPQAVLRRMAEVHRALFAQAPTRPATPLSPDEEAYYELLHRGDLARERGARAEALRLYQDAEALHAARGLALPNVAVEQRRALVSTTAPAKPSVLPPPIAAPETRPPAPAATGPSASGHSSTSADEARFLADPRGQWAVSARAGSEYGSVQNAAAQAAGPPDVPSADDHPNAWCPARRTGGVEWLELTFARPVHATEVRVRQSFGAVGIVKIEGLEAEGSAQVLWEGRDSRAAAHAREIVWFAASFPRTARPIVGLRLTLDLDSHPGWKQVDAVQLVGEP